MLKLLPLLLLLAILPALPASSLVLDSGAENDAPPADDPGWSHVGWMGLNGVYVGHGWVLTAGHVAVTPGNHLTLDGVDYPVIPESRVVFEHAPGTDADLAAFRIDPYPTHLPLLPIRATSPPEDTEVVLIGRGRDAGTASSWGAGGWNWAGTGPKRWGKNFIGGSVPFWPGTSTSIPLVFLDTQTQSLILEFNDVLNPASDPDPDPSATQPVAQDEAAVAEGDSGSGLFAYNDVSGMWELAGIAWLVTRLNGQPANTSIYGNDSAYVDLSYYRDAVLATVRPCADGVDNDGDGNIDLADGGCFSEADVSEIEACGDGIDNDYDGIFDLADPDCSDPSDLLEAPDADSDLVVDTSDNCTAVANANQLDGDSDGYGDACDADFNNDGAVGSPDINLLIGRIGTTEGDANFNSAFDISGDSAVGMPDFALLIGAIGSAPGPSGLACAGTVPCP